MTEYRCDDCGWMKQNIDTAPLSVFRLDDPLIHCPNCDLLQAMSSSNHTPTFGLTRPPKDL